MRWRWELVKTVFGRKPAESDPLAEYAAEWERQLVNVDMTLSPKQLREYEAVFNDCLEHPTERQRAKFLEPPSVGLSIGDIWSQSAIERPVDQ